MDSKIFREAALAYQAVYDEELRQEIEEQQDFENWVNSLVEEGYDLSEYTWEEMYEAYITEIGGLPRGLTPEKARAQNAAAAQGFRNIGNAVRTVTNPMGAIVRGMQDATTRYREAGPRDVRGRPLNQRSAQTPARPAATTPAARPAPAPAARPSGGSRPAPAPAARPSGGSSAPAARPAASAPTAKPSPTPSAAAPAKPTPAPSTPAAKPSAMDQWAKANPKLAAAKAERDRTRGTSSTTNPQMADLKSKLPTAKTSSSATPAPKPTPSTPTASTPKPIPTSSTATPAAKPTPTPVKRPGGSVKPGSIVSGFDLFDVVKGYLIDEGFAETEHAAIAIMANMSEEWKLEIIDEAVKGESSDRRRALAAERRKGIKPLSAKEGEKYASHKISQMAYTKRAKMGDDD